MTKALATAIGVDPDRVWRASMAERLRRDPELSEYVEGLAGAERPTEAERDLLALVRRRLGFDGASMLHRCLESASTTTASNINLYSTLEALTEVNDNAQQTLWALFRTLAEGHQKVDYPPWSPLGRAAHQAEFQNGAVRRVVRRAHGDPT